MKRCKTLLSVLLALLLLCSLLPAAAMAEWTEDGTYEYELDESGNATITCYNGPGGDLTIPDTLDGHPVTSIGDEAFSCRYELTSVTIPAGVTSIGNDAFGCCYALKDIWFPGTQAQGQGRESSVARVGARRVTSSLARSPRNTVRSRSFRSRSSR